MIMMTKKPSSELAGYKMLSAVPVAGLVFLLVSATPLPPPPPPPPPPSAAAITSDENEVPFVVVEEMPMYPGGDAELLKDISAMTVYPESAKQNNIQGRVIIKFCVTSKGTVSQVSILKGVEASLDNEALRVVSNLKKFIPGRQGGKAVPVRYMVPITFTLK
jgi:protein TonB